jgi:hypothetical protein
MQRDGWCIVLAVFLMAVGVAPARPEAQTEASPNNAGRAGATPTTAASCLPTSADLSAFSLLTSARQALQRLDTVQDDVDRQSAFSAAIESLVGLYQLHGCAWALPALREVYAREGSSELSIGYSADGRVRLRVEPLELKNPAFAEYTFLLVTLESHTSLTLKAQEFGPLSVRARDGIELEPQRIDEAHPLWPNLSGLAGTFTPPRVLPPTYGISFKQVYGVKLAFREIESFELHWGDYELEVPVGEMLPTL